MWVYGRLVYCADCRCDADCACQLPAGIQRTRCPTGVDGLYSLDGWTPRNSICTESQNIGLGSLYEYAAHGLSMHNHSLYLLGSLDGGQKLPPFTIIWYWAAKRGLIAGATPGADGGGLGAGNRGVAKGGNDGDGGYIGC